MKKIKIIQILHCVGGVDIWLRIMLQNINSDKFENIIVHGVNDTKPFLDTNKNLIKEYRTTIFRNISIVNEINAIFDCIKIIKKEKPDLLHVHSAKGGVIGRIVGIITKTKVLYTPHAFSYLSEKNSFKRFIYLLIEKILSNGNSVLLATSKSETVRAIDEVGYNKGKTIIFNNSINPVSSIEKLSISKTWPDEYICTVGRPSYQKNIELMIKILFEINKIKNIHLVIMGVGHHMGQLASVNELIASLNLTDKVTLLKWTKREDVFNIIDNSKLYISTSRYEGLPYSIIESLALAKPCVVSDCDGNRDLIIDNYNGYIIKGDDVQLYKDKILDLLNNDELQKEFSDNAYSTFDNNYNIVKNIKLLEQIYSNAINELKSCS